MSKETSETYAKIYNRDRLDGNMRQMRERLANPEQRKEAADALNRFEHYIAYGSNINLDQMRLRCPSSTPTHALLLVGGRLTFRSNRGWTGVADIGGVDNNTTHDTLVLPSKKIPFGYMVADNQFGGSSIVPMPPVVLAVQLYTLKLEDMVALDVFEGYQPQGESFYTRIYCVLRLPDGSQTRAMTYKMTGGEPAPPDELYADVIREGYRQRELPLPLLDAALTPTA